MSLETRIAYRCIFAALLAFSVVTTVSAQESKDETKRPQTEEAATQDYRVQPGDVLFISVWREENLQREVAVQPDGAIRFPLAGEVNATGLSLAEIEERLKKQLSTYIPEPAVSVSLLQALGNRIFVVGRVNSPGEYILRGKIDVMQAIALAGGTTPFAKKKQIKVLRGNSGEQRVLGFNYKEVEKGQRLGQNIFLMPGDTVVVP